MKIISLKFLLPDCSKYILTPNQNSVSLTDNILSNNLINDNSIQKLNITNYRYDDMDETDYSQKKSFVSQDVVERRPKIFCCGGGESLNVKSLLSRPGGAVQIVTSNSGQHTIDRRGDNHRVDNDVDEVGDTKKQISTITLSPTKLIDKTKIEYLSDNHLDKIGDGCSELSGLGGGIVGGRMPSTSARSQNDLIQFVFTSHGIRVISDKEYVV